MADEPLYYDHLMYHKDRPYEVKFKDKSVFFIRTPVSPAKRSFKRRYGTDWSSMTYRQYCARWRIIEKKFQQRAEKRKLLSL